MVRFHSYQGQDRYVVAATRGQRGFFLDSGASDGYRGSNSLTLERDFGWRGICIEPNDAMFDRLRRHRRATCLNCCLFDRNGDVEFFEAAGVYGGIISHYDPAHLRFAEAAVGRALDPSLQQLRRVRKPARTIGSILRECGAPAVIDYWSLDTEGSELAILRSFPFDEFRLRFVTVEHNHSPTRGLIESFLRSKGMRRVHVLGIDDVYASVDLPATVSPWRSAAWSQRRTTR